MRNQYPEHQSAFPCSPTDSDRKEYCTYWIRHGECDYMQQGCRYKHEMPDIMTLRSIGFRNVPEWHKEKMRMRNMQRPGRPHPDVLQSILNQTNDDSVSESGSDDSDATLAVAEATRCLIVIQNATPSPAPSTIDLLSFDDDEDEDSSPEQGKNPKVPANTPETSSYALPNLPTPNRQGRFVPAGESLPRMSTSPLLPGPPSPTFYKKEEPKAVVEKTVYTAPPRPAPVFKQYLKEIKATKSQEILQEEVVVKTSPLISSKNVQIAELQARLAALAADGKVPPTFKSSIVPAIRVKTPPAPASSLTRVGGMARDGGGGGGGRAMTGSSNGGLVNGGGLMASKHADRQPQVHSQGQNQEQRKVGRRSRSRARGVQKSSEGPGSGEKRSRRLPAARARKVVSPKAVGGEREKVGVGKK